MDSSIYGMSDDYHYNKTVGKIFGGFIVGSSLSYLGGVVGFFIGGPPGAMVGSFLLGAIGTYYGENIGKSAVDDYYRANNLFIP